MLLHGERENKNRKDKHKECQKLAYSNLQIDQSLYKVFLTYS